MKKFLFALAFAATALVSNSAMADICVPSDPDFDAADCGANGGTIGTPIGISGGPGGPGGPAAGVPIDGGLSVLLALGGAAGIRRFTGKKKIA